MNTVEPIYLDVEVSEEEYELELDTKIVVNHIGGDPYEGPYTVTPSSSEQTLLTQWKTMGDNVVIEPIPNNYGLITWNGSVLTVS